MDVYSIGHLRSLSIFIEFSPSSEMFMQVLYIYHNGKVSYLYAEKMILINTQTTRFPQSKHTSIA